jgi:hypothetical protein
MVCASDTPNKLFTPKHYNQMNTCYIIDDDYYSISVLSGYIAKFDTLKLMGSSLNPLQGVYDINNL